MNITKQHREQQETKQLQSEISSFIDVDNQVTTLNKSTSKLRGASSLTFPRSTSARRKRLPACLAARRRM